MTLDSPSLDSRSGLAAWLQRPLSRTRNAIATDDLLQHGGLMAGATVVSGGFNYGYQVFMGRALGPAQFGVFGALFAMFYLVAVVGRGIRFSASRFVAEFDADDPSLAGYHRGFFLRAVAGGLLVFGAIALTSRPLARFLGVTSPWLVVLVGAIVPLSLAFTANKGTLQGRQWFGALGGAQILLAGVKFATGVGLVLAGYGLAGALGAIAVGTVVALVGSTALIRWRLPRASVGDESGSPDFAAAYRYTLPAVLAGFCLTVPGTVDVIVAQHAVAGLAAGWYAAVAVLGKILVFLPLGITAALFPKVSTGHAEPDAPLLGLLGRGLCYAGVVTGAGTLTYLLVPRLVLRAFFGAAYVGAAPLLRWYGVAILAFVLAVVVLYFELARDGLGFVYAFTGATLVEIGLLWAVGGSPVAMAQVILVVNAGLFAVGLYEVGR